MVNINLKGNTEIILNNLNPQFETKVVVPYNNKQPRKMRLEVYHIIKVKEKDQLKKQKLLGSTEVCLSDIVFEVNIFFIKYLILIFKGCLAKSA